MAQLKQQLAQAELEHDSTIQSLQTEIQNYQAAVSQIEQELLRRKSKFDSLQTVAAENEKQLRESLAAKDAESSA